MNFNLKILLAISIFAAFFSCKKIEKTAVSGGKIVYKSENLPLKNARCENFGAEQESGLKTLHLFFHSSTITMNEDETKGTGTILALEIISLSDTLQNSVYQISENFEDKTISKENSYLTIISKEDTITISLSDGYFNIENDNELSKKFSFHFISENGDSISGNFRGAVSYNLLYDMPQVAVFQIDTVNYAIQKGNMFRWGKILDKNLFYYEILFYSTNLRRTDAGKIKSGFELVLGMHSLSSDYPQNGVYLVSRTYENNTLLGGEKIGNANWGTLWNFYTNGSASKRSIVVSGDVNFERDGDNFKISLNLKDMENNTITGEYDGELKITDYDL
ncbi:MAG: hypothetical protein LBS50_03825 [Prevotellaceae bacterium]|jgi:hypothetical protein|nr:hypothetical protein [Prevotellaceae bacterium]